MLKNTRKTKTLEIILLRFWAPIIFFLKKNKYYFVFTFHSLFNSPTKTVRLDNRIEFNVMTYRHMALKTKYMKMLQILFYLTHWIIYAIPIFNIIDADVESIMLNIYRTNINIFVLLLWWHDINKRFSRRRLFKRPSNDPNTVKFSVLLA